MSAAAISTVIASKLAIDGGPAIRKNPFASWPFFEDDEIEAAAAVLRTGKVNYWTGDEVRQFEAEYAKYVGTKFAIAVSNGTAALELALYALGVGPGDEVITSSRTFIACGSSIALRGARPVMADVDQESGNITAETVRDVLTARTKAIIAVHLAGWPCDMDSIMSLAGEHGLKVIEDCAQAHGARYKGRSVGSIGHINAFSFCQDKIVTTGGEGGMVTTNEDDLWRRAWSYKDHGKHFEAASRQPRPPGFRWLHDSFGTNWRLTEMQAAIGRVQLSKLNSWVMKRRRFAEILDRAFSELSALRTVSPEKDLQHSYYKYYVFVRPDRLADGWHRDRIVRSVVAEGVPCFSGSCSEIYLEKAFEGIRPENRLPVARLLGETSLMFMVHPTLSDVDMNDTVLAVRKVMERACK